MMEKRKIVYKITNYLSIICLLATFTVLFFHFIINNSFDYAFFIQLIVVVICLNTLIRCIVYPASNQSESTSLWFLRRIGFGWSLNMSNKWGKILSMAVFFILLILFVIAFLSDYH